MKWFHVKNRKSNTKVYFILICMFILLFLNITVNYASSVNYLYLTRNLPLLYIESQLGEDYDDITYFDKQGNMIEDYLSIVKTGIRVHTDEGNIDYKTVIRGDLDGDGDIDLDDKHLMKLQLVGLARFRE